MNLLCTIIFSASEATIKFASAAAAHAIGDWVPMEVTIDYKAPVSIGSRLEWVDFRFCPYNLILNFSPSCGDDGHLRWLGMGCGFEFFVPQRGFNCYKEGYEGPLFPGRKDIHVQISGNEFRVFGEVGGL